MATFKDLHIKNSKNYKRRYCPHHTDCGNGGRSGENAIGSIRWPIPENPPIGAKISQKSLIQSEL